MSFVILYETPDLYVVEKPAGWLTTPARAAADPRPCLGRELSAQVGRQIFPVHRLDFEVSGLTVWAKNPAAHTQAQKWFEDQQIDKIYHAYARAGDGPPPEARQEWRSCLVRGK